MHFQLNNSLGATGTTINISADRTNETKGLILIPGVAGDISFSSFGSEPMGWTFTVTTDSDAFLVSFQLFSTWIPGDPPNG